MQNPDRRKPLFALAVLASLVLATAANGCSSGRDPDDTDTDAGTPVDAGKKPDAGTKPDAGVTPDAGGGDPTTDGTVGSACTATEPAVQGSCGQDLICIRGPSANESADKPTIFPLGACTKGCETDDDCGMNGSTKNLCQEVPGTGGDKICFRACDPLVLDSCGRPSHVCNAAANGRGVCTPRCDAADVCPEGFECDTSTGKCGGKEYYEECPVPTTEAEAICSISPVRACVAFQGTGGICINTCATATDCPGGSVCDLSFTENGQTVKFCTKKCGGALDPACPAGTECGAMQGIPQKMCLPKQVAGTNAVGAPCGGESGGCVAGARCEQLSAGGARCFKDCTTAATACAAPTQCFGLQGTETKLCLQPCGQPNTQACPTGTTCQQNACLP